MKVIVSYDVSTLSKEGRRRLRRAARICKDYGVRVQYSVFECSVTDTEWVKLRAGLLNLIDETEDSLRLYRLSEDDAQKTEHFGVRVPMDPDGPLVV